MEALILAIIIAYAVKKAAERSHQHWQGSKAANRKASKGKPVSKRAASAVQHDWGYWLQQVLNGFPQARSGLAAGWHAGRTAQAQGAEARRKARTEHLERQVRLLGEIREHRRRQAEALEQIRAARQPEPEPEPELSEPAASAAPASPPPPDRGGAHVTPPTEGTPMSGDTTYTQQMAELEAIRRDAEEEVNSVRRKRMTSRLDILQSLGLDKDTLSEAAEIDDALQAQEKAAQQTLDATDAAISGLKQRHGGIKEAVDDSPVGQPADAPFYKD
jgi:hypothetical protein